MAIEGGGNDDSEDDSLTYIGCWIAPVDEEEEKPEGILSVEHHTFEEAQRNGILSAVHHTDKGPFAEAQRHGILSVVHHTDEDTFEDTFQEAQMPLSLTIEGGGDDDDDRDILTDVGCWVAQVDEEEEVPVGVLSVQHHNVGVWVAMVHASADMEEEAPVRVLSVEHPTCDDWLTRDELEAKRRAVECSLGSFPCSWTQACRAPCL
jgi:hypothetical protein